ncbi:MAG TPA: hypothetical protein VFY29_20070 [Terriglobia bacterium]|nr:hypothetical protein [Terriglobia bacterium]
MKIGDIDRFFDTLGKRVEFPLQILLTGEAAGILLGMERATFDIDFEVRLKLGGARDRRAASDRWEVVRKAMTNTAHATGITPQYAEDIDKWSSIALPSKRSRLYRRFGKVEVRILDPGLWAIGKLTRYLSTDVQDLRVVLKHANLRPIATVRLWGTALGISNVSSAQGLFRRQVESFLDRFSREIWGPGVDPSALNRTFLESARKAREQRGGRD